MQRKIIHLLYSGLGGHGSVFFSLAKADAHREFNTIALFYGIENVRADYINKCREHDIPFSFIKKKPGLDAASGRKVYSSFRRERPDTIFLHGISMVVLYAIAYKLLHRKTKLVVRDTQAHHLKTRMEWRWFRLATRHADRLVFLTQESLDTAIEKTGLKYLKDKATIISNGLDTDVYLPMAPRDISQRCVIGMQSRLQPIKDHQTLLRAFSLLAGKVKDRELFLRIAGDGETMNELKEQSRSLGIDDRVEFCGMLDEQELLRFMHSLDIYVHATQGETMSNSIMQSLACGLPTVASDVWGVNNVVKHGNNGLLTKPGDAEDLAQQIENLMLNAELRNQLSRSARAYALKNYSLNTLFNEYKNIF